MTESADIERIGIWEIDEQIRERLLYGRPYSNERLEAKRRQAILYLRYNSSRGYVLDQGKRWGK